VDVVNRFIRTVDDNPVIGQPWTLSPLHGRWNITGTVTDITGELT
jgi:hypothetical protein